MAKFIQEVSLYDDKAIAKVVKRTNTQFQVLNGKIAAVVSEDDIIQLRNGSQTVFSKLTSVEQTADKISQRVKTIEDDYVTSTAWELENGKIYGEISDNSGNITNIQGTLDGWIFGNGSSSTKIDGGMIQTDSIKATTIDTDTLIVSGRAYTPSTGTGDKIIRIESASVANADVGNTQIQKGKLAIYGLLPIYNSSGRSIGAYIGYDRGYDGSSTTYGASLQAASGSNNVIVTSSGAAMNGGNAAVACYNTGSSTGNVTLQGYYVNFDSRGYVRPTSNATARNNGCSLGGDNNAFDTTYTYALRCYSYFNGTIWVPHTEAIKGSNSDENLKKDIEYGEYGKIIDDLTPVSFRKNIGDDTELRHLGLKAGELVKVLENNDMYGYGIVSYSEQPDDTVRLAINYDEITVALVSKCQELQKQNDELERRLIALEETLMNK